MEIKKSSNWYVMQVITGKEKKVEALLLKLKLNSLVPFLPKKKLKIKKRGIVKDLISPLYPGYIFIIGEWNIEEAKKMIKSPGAIKFIGGVKSPGILLEEEKGIIKKIAKTGVAEYSKVIKIGNKIRVLSGALKEFEGVIESVDRRKQRAIVRLPLLNSMVKVTLGFEYIESKEKS